MAVDKGHVAPAHTSKKSFLSERDETWTLLKQWKQSWVSLVTAWCLLHWLQGAGMGLNHFWEDLEHPIGSAPREPGILNAGMLDDSWPCGGRHMAVHWLWLHNTDEYTCSWDRSKNLG